MVIDMKILVINCGSSSIKFQFIDAETENLIAKGICERIGIEGSQVVYTKIGEEKEKRQVSMKDHTEAVQVVLSMLMNESTGVVKNLNEIGAVGHRLVHGGEKFANATIITDEVIKAIEECSDLAPLHNPANLIGISACRKCMPNVPMAGIFDTAFHQTMPEIAYLYAIPYRYYEKYKLRRYGFHGTSHAYVSEKAAGLIGKDYHNSKIIVCHLGNGSSVSAVKNGACVDTSMGLTPLEGLIMGTRCGDIDPAIIEYLAKKEEKSLDEVMNILNKESGILGLSDGFSSDFRDIEEAYFKNDVVCTRALKAFSYRVAKYIGAYTAAMNGVDAICFTAGVGENSPDIREMVCSYLGYLGVSLDKEANHRRGEDCIISSKDSSVAILNIGTNEELAIARATYSLLKN